MIYDKVHPDAPIRQGDIFSNIPYTSIDLNKVIFKREDGLDIQTSRWGDVDSFNNLVALLSIVPTWAIVLSQDCDASRAPAISFFRIENLSQVLNNAGTPKNAKKWMEFIVNELTKKKWNTFYLPADHSDGPVKIGFNERMFINLETVFQVERNSLETHKATFRMGRLNDEGYEHFRETIAQYFRRYPYEEHYSLTKEEIDEYELQKGLVKRYEYQK